MSLAVAENATPVAAPAPVVPAPVAPRYRLKESALTLSVHANTHWSATVAPGTPFEEVLKPEFWAHVSRAKNWEFGDVINVKPVEAHYWCQVLVCDVGQGWLKVEVIPGTFIALSPTDRDGVDEFPGYRIEWTNITTKYAVIREKDKELLKSGFKTKHAASNWLVEHMKAMVR